MPLPAENSVATEMIRPTVSAIIGVPRNWRICAKSPVHLAMSTMDLTAIRTIGMTIGAKEMPAPGS